STQPWQLDGVLNKLTSDGYKDIVAVENKTVVTDPIEGAKQNKWYNILSKYNIQYKPLTKEKWIKYKLKDTLALHEFFGDEYVIPEIFKGSNIIHLPTVKTHGHTTITGAMKNAFGGLITEKRHHCHRKIHEVLVDLLKIQKDIHPGLFAVADGTVCGDGKGPRTMIPKIKNYILASEDQVAIDAVSAKMMGFDPMKIKFIRLAHDLGLGNADLDTIDIVGISKNEFNSINFNFKTGKSPVIFFDQLLRSRIKIIEPLLFHTGLFNLCIFGSEFYHDYLWYPLFGKRIIKKFNKTEWGKLFSRY
ncbi:MAG: DUF362 domain-containing protein, partial [Nanoarchaeota archaeon]